MVTIDLSARVVALGTRFLDDQMSREADVDFEPDTDSIAAFRLLVHAEIEHWLEKKAMVAIEELRVLVGAGLTVRGSFRLMLCGAVFGHPVTFALPHDEASLVESIETLLNKAKTFVSDNNSIKTETFCKVATLCGVPLDEVDAALLQALDKYGKARGDVAHKSVGSVSTLYAPSAELSAAKSLVSALEHFFKSVTAV